MVSHDLFSLLRWISSLRCGHCICDHLAEGKFVIAVDNEDRENEGDLIIAAEKVTTEQMAFLIRHSR